MDIAICCNSASACVVELADTFVMHLFCVPPAEFDQPHMHSQVNF